MTGLLLDHLWQSSLFAAAAALVALALGRNRAQVRFWVWFAAAVKFLVPFVLIAWAAGWIAAHLHAQAPAPPRLELARQMLAPMTASARAHAVRPHGSPSLHLWPYLYAAWGLGSAAVLGWRLAQWRALRKALAGATPLALPTPLPAVASRAKAGPAVVGFLRPVLVLPPSLTEQLTPAELEAVLEHELHHARRMDNLLTLPLLAAQALFCFHPLIWWIGRRLMVERERACDEAVVDGGIDAETYARGLLEVCRLELTPSPAWAAGVTGADLKRRIRRIMSERAARPLGAAGRATLAAGLGAALAVPVLAGVFIAPVVATRLLASLPHPRLAAIAAAAPVAEPRPALVHARRAVTAADQVVLSAQNTVLVADAEPAPRPEPVLLTRRALAPAFDRLSAAAPSGEATSLPVSAPASLLQALAAKTDHVIDAGAWGDRLELRTADSGRACPTVQVQRAEAALGGEAISTAFDGAVRDFVEASLAGRPAGRDLTADMARAVDARLPALQPALARTFAGSGRARLLGEDSRGRDVYLVSRGGREAYVLVRVDDDSGQIEAALFCAPS